MKRLARLLAEQQAKGHIEDLGQSSQAKPDKPGTAQINSADHPRLAGTDQRSGAPVRRGRQISSAAAQNDAAT